MKKYSVEQILEALKRIEQKYPMLFKWFFIWELENWDETGIRDEG